MSFGYAVPSFRFQPNVIGWSHIAQSESIPSIVAVVTLPDYQFVWVPRETSFLKGDNPNISWLLTRADGLLDPLPVQATITIFRPDGGQDSIAIGNIYGNSAVPVAAVTVGSVYQFNLVGTYILVLSLTLNTGVGPTQTRQVMQQIQVATIPVLNATYVPGTLMGLTRFYAGDTTVTSAIFSDAEILAALSANLQVAELAAAALLRAAASNASYVAAITNKGTFGNDESKIPQALEAAADKWQSIAPIAPVVIAAGSTTQSAPLPVFTNDDLSSPNAAPPATDSSQGGTTWLW
jgi:hypothetical protein